MTIEREELSIIVGEMRQLGVLHFEAKGQGGAGIVITLGPEPPKPPAEVTPETADEREARAMTEQVDDLRVLLHSSGADAGPILQAMRGKP
jgi:hypothetical protein